ncbi:ABC transporter ATP-binding protein [Caldivirga sp.]|uniref:ABC transporter ATP-binding protein n=1 Tax=Caldivirga sp. TaxID=2080243 RepID=UPI003D0B4573
MSNRYEYLLEVDNVSKAFIERGRSINALTEVSFKIPSDKPTVFAILGESGAGKSTLARIVLGLIEPTSGDVKYKGISIREWLRSDSFTFRREVQPIFQDPYGVYNPSYRVDRVLELAVRKFKIAKSKREAMELITKTLKSIGLRPEDVLGRYPHQLSGGERQRLLIARILLIRPKLVVADEPVSMVDVSVKATILNHLRELKEKYNVSVLYITHEIPTAYYIADEAMVLFYGYVVEQAPMNTLVEKPLHPYTQELLKVLPNPDPNNRYASDKFSEELSRLATAAEAGRPAKGCPYQNRCPFAMPKCRESLPPLTRIDGEHYVRCFLY